MYICVFGPQLIHCYIGQGHRNVKNLGDAFTPHPLIGISLMYLPKICGDQYVLAPLLGVIHYICVKPSPFGIVYGCPSKFLLCHSVCFIDIKEKAGTFSFVCTLIMIKIIHMLYLGITFSTTSNYVVISRTRFG